ncbi:hypothetical protein ABZ464_32140 [Streptomyces sp. NPDC005820]|uniref:hypothetical protein n=1 Tax=Streptomyces sp. NPDC005820 TaxID=3157069 RepID=UPI003409A21F
MTALHSHPHVRHPGRPTPGAGYGDAPRRDYGGGYGCLAPGEYFADYLADNMLNNGFSPDSNIRSAKWGTSSACSVSLTCPSEREAGGPA